MQRQMGLSEKRYIQIDNCKTTHVLCRCKSSLLMKCAYQGIGEFFLQEDILNSELHFLRKN